MPPCYSLPGNYFTIPNLLQITLSQSNVIQHFCKSLDVFLSFGNMCSPDINLIFLQGIPPSVLLDVILSPKPMRPLRFAPITILSPLK